MALAGRALLLQQLHIAHFYTNCNCNCTFFLLTGSSLCFSGPFLAPLFSLWHKIIKLNIYKKARAERNPRKLLPAIFRKLYCTQSERERVMENDKNKIVNNKTAKTVCNKIICIKCTGKHRHGHSPYISRKIHLMEL